MSLRKGQLSNYNHNSDATVAAQADLQVMRQKVQTTKKYWHTVFTSCKNILNCKAGNKVFHNHIHVNKNKVFIDL